MPQPADRNIVITPQSPRTRRVADRAVAELVDSLLPVLLDVDSSPLEALRTACERIADFVDAPVAVYLADGARTGTLLVATSGDFAVELDAADDSPVVLPCRRRAWFAVAGRSVDVVPAAARAVVGRLLADVAADHDLRAEHTFTDHSARVIRRMVEQGIAAESVEDAGAVLARITADAFGTDRAAVHLVDSYGRIRHVVGVGAPPAVVRELEHRLLGRTARDSDIYRRAEQAHGPVLVDDGESVEVRAGGFVSTMGLRSFVAMPLMSAAGPIGMAVCGDTGPGRVWTDRERSLAAELARTGALVVENVRLRQAEQQHLTELAHRAFHDPLTGLPNRSLFADRAGQALADAALSGRKVAVVFIDLDGFKEVNDRCGHHVGDELLRITAQRMSRTLRQGDTIARLGGDEFGILFTDPDAIEVDLETIARRVTLRLSQPCEIDGETVQVGASVGVAVFPDHAAELDDLLECADLAMYRCKRVTHQPEIYA